MFHKCKPRTNLYYQIPISFTVSLLVSLVLTSCLPKSVPDTAPTDSPPASSGEMQDSKDGENKDGDLTVEIVDLPERICIGQSTNVTLTQSGFSGTRGDITWFLRFGPVYKEKTTLKSSYIFASLKPIGPARTEPVRARVEINELSGDDEMPLSDLTPEIGTDEKTTDYIYCNYNLNLAYGGDFIMEIFNIKEAGYMTVPLAVDPSTGKITGSGALNLARSTGFSEGGVDCDVLWEGAINVEVNGSLKSLAGKSDLTLEWTFENTAIEDSQMTCSNGISVPAKGGPIDFSAWGLNNLKFSLEGGAIMQPVSQALGPSHSGSGQVTITLEPATGD